MKKVLKFIRKERLYILLLIFVLLINVLVVTAEKGAKVKGKKAEDIFVQRAALESKLANDKHLALLLNLASLLIFSVIILGIFVDSSLLSLKLAKKKMDITTQRIARTEWGIIDVLKVVILFLFFGYMVVIIESLLAGVAPILKDNNFRMMLNSSILDISAAIFIIYFAVIQYKGKIVSLGLSLKNFIKNVYYGLIGYVAAVPILVGTLIVIVIIVNITKYVPERQPVVELFLKEDNATFLAYTSLFAAVVGPMIEELFFRGFMYGALRGRIGILWAMLFTSAVFAGLHTNVVGFLPIMVLGILLAYLYEKTGTLVSSITVHVIHNLSMVFFVFLLKQLRV